MALLYLVEHSVLHIEIDLGDDVSVKIKHKRPHLSSLRHRRWFSDEAEEEVRHLAVVPGEDIKIDR